MLSTDFASIYEKERSWDDWYSEEVVHTDFAPTIFFSYKGQMYQFEHAGGLAGEVWDGKKVLVDSYVFTRVRGVYGNYEWYGPLTLFDSLKEAIDYARMDDGKTFKEIWRDPDSELITCSY